MFGAPRRPPEPSSPQTLLVAWSYIGVPCAPPAGGRSSRVLGGRGASDCFQLPPLIPTRQFWGGIYRARTAPPAPTHLLNGWQRKCATSVHRPSDLALPRSDPRGLARDTAIVVDSAVGGVRLHRPTRWQLLRSRRRWRSRCGRADFDVADSRRRFGLALGGAEVVPTCVASVANFEWRRCAVWVWVACGE